MSRLVRVVGFFAVIAWTGTILAAGTARAENTERDVTEKWRASPAVTVERREMAFSNGPVQLSGTLYAPKIDGRVPAIVVFHAASCPTRDLPLYRHLSQMLPPLGIAVFVYDRRGSGKSTGVLAESDYDALADDGIAAQKMLAQDPHIDAKRIGFWGLSQGGWLSLLAATRSPDAAFAISISAPMTTPDVQMNFAVANILRIKGYSETDVSEAIAARTAVDNFERGQLDRPTTQARLDAVVGKPWFDLTYLDKTFRDPNVSRWAKEIRHDPVKTLDAVKIPALVIYGSNDPWVPAQRSVDILRASAKQHPSITTAIIAGADHDMMLSASPAAQVDPAGLNAQAPESAEYFGLLASWLTAQGLTRKQ
ncbi:MAG: alpha/beta fold hydrolase [Burkholderiales bacterium]|nr:alpha/beta fold hydrolase [Burkholderiales bacterium]